MSDRHDVLHVIERRTGVERRDGESRGRYLSRVDDEFGLDEDDRERVTALAQKQAFAPDPTLSDTERAELESICAKLTDGTRTAGQPSSKDAGVSDETGQSPTEPAVDSNATDPLDASGEGAAATNQLLKEPEATATVSEQTKSTRTNGAGTADTSIGSLLSLKRTRHGLESRSGLRDALTGRDLVYLVPLLVAGTYVFFYKVGITPLSTMDEGFYANLARHMVQDGHWTVPHMYYLIGQNTVGFEPWLNLPPFGMWLQAVSMLVFGINEFAVRLPSAAASVLTVGVVYCLGRSVATRRAGFFTGLVYLTTPYVYAGFNAGRDGALDALLVLFGSLFVYTAWLAAKRENPRWLYPMGLFGALAVLTKGFGAGVFLIVALPFAFLKQDVFRSKVMAHATVLTAALTLPWPLYMYIQYGDTFTRVFFERYILSRATEATFGQIANTLLPFMDYPYIQDLLFSPSLFHPWTFMLLFAIAAVGYRHVFTEREGRFETGVLIWWVFVAFGLFVFIGNRRWYIMPMFVPAAALIGSEIETALAGSESALGAVTIGVLATFVVSPEFSLISDAGGSSSAGMVLAISTVLLIWFNPIRDQFHDRLPNSVYESTKPLVSVVVVLVLVGALIGIPPTSTVSNQKALAEEVREESPTSTPVFIQTGMPRPFHTFSFYVQRPLGSGNISEFRASGMRYAVLQRDSLDRVQSEYRVLMNTTVRDQNVILVEVNRQ